jgi:molybdenum cofactor synthesis domain-containing protein
VKAAVLTVSDGVTHGTREDRSGDALAELLAGDGHEVVRRVVPDERDAIAAAIADLARGAELVLTTGGTGLAPRDMTPEATLDVIERLAPGIPEALRADSIAKTPHGLLSRGVAGVRGRTLVVNLPGSPGGCRDGYAVLRPALIHAVELLAGEGATTHRQT